MYRAELSQFEQVALDRCLSVLGNHPITLVTPHTLAMQKLPERYRQLTRETFQDEYFDGISGYNRLLLSDEFYARFARYKFILVHQLDAFVFSDQLLAWCAHNYDYVGAPWLPTPELPNRRTLARIGITRRLHRIFDKQHETLPAGNISWTQFHYGVGNGGFSLRLVSSMRKTLAKLHERAELYRWGSIHPWSEDVFYSVEPNRYWNHLRIPGLQEAARFSWESFPVTAAQLTGGALPFGCHAWDRLYRDDWRPIFARHGYDLDEILASNGH